jgi:hypothetical protein
MIDEGQREQHEHVEADDQRLIVDGQPVDEREHERAEEVREFGIADRLGTQADDREHCE